MDEPRYVEEGDEFEDFVPGSRSRPVWTIPDTEFQKRVLRAVGRHYFPDKSQGGRSIRTRLIDIERSMISAETPGVLAKAIQALEEEWERPVWVREWVENCVSWFERKNKVGYVPLYGLLSFLYDRERMLEFMKRWKATGKPVNDYEADPYG